MKATVTGFFDAAHQLPYMPELYSTSCMNVHGHTYKVEITVFAYEAIPMVVDFGIIKAIIKSFDHKRIEQAFDDIGWSGEPTTAENIVRAFEHKLRMQLPESVKLWHIALWEGWKGDNSNKIEMDYAK